MNRISQLREHKELRFVRKGLLLALFSGMIWTFDGLLLGRGLVAEPFNRPEFWLLAPLFAAGVHDFCGACLSLALNIAQGKGREVFRTLFSGPGRFCLYGALFGAPLGMGGYILALSMAGPAYVLPITSLYPAIAALLAFVFLKERISRLAWCGLALCVLGAVTIGYTPSESTGSLFLLGIAFAFLAAVGWAVEGVCVTSGMDFIDPAVALNVYQLLSSLLYACIIIPSAVWYTRGAVPDFSPAVLMQALSGSVPVFFVLAGIIGCLAYRCWYRSLNMTGVSRGMALNITYALWGVLFSALFTDTEITHTLVMGAVMIFAGMCLVIGNPRDLVNLRTV